MHETYQDFIFIFMEEYNIPNLSISNEGNKIFEMCVNSFTPIRNLIKSDENIKFIKIKLNSFLMSKSDYDYFYNNLMLYPQEAYKLGLEVTFKLVLSALYSNLRQKAYHYIFQFVL